jgi:SpoVK/Ycf46/Vps4 family AAA+-type ATPase
VKQVAAFFSRAKGHSPSLIFIDEMDAFLPQIAASLGQHDVQVVDQFLMGISSLQAENRAFLVGATNHPEGIDARVLRDGRYSEKLRIGLPGPDGRERPGDCSSRSRTKRGGPSPASRRVSLLSI